MSNETYDLDRYSDILPVTYLEFQLLEDAASNSNNAENAREKLKELIISDNKLKFYETYGRQASLDLDGESLRQIKNNVDAITKKLNESAASAKKAHSEIDLLKSYVKSANFYATIGDYELAEQFFALALTLKHIDHVMKSDINLTRFRIAFFTKRYALAKIHLNQANKHYEKSFDWTIKNKINIYQAIYSLVVESQYDTVCESLVDSAQIFNSPEIIDYNIFAKLTVWLLIATQPRNKLASCLKNSSELNQVLQTNEQLQELVNCFVKCEYKKFYRVLHKNADEISHNLYTKTKLSYFINAFRLTVLKQCLVPYQTYAIKNMADTFGVTEDFIESEIFYFIVSNDIPYQINDKDRIIKRIADKSLNRDQKKFIDCADMLLDQLRVVSKIIDI